MEREALISPGRSRDLPIGGGVINRVTMEKLRGGKKKKNEHRHMKLGGGGARASSGMLRLVETIQWERNWDSVFGTIWSGLGRNSKGHKVTKRSLSA